MYSSNNESKLADNKAGLSSVGANKVLCLSLVVLMILECILVLLPVVEVESSWLNQTWSFTLFDLLDDDMVVNAIIVLHLVSIIAVAVPMIVKRIVDGIYYIAAYTTAVLTFCINMIITINIESLLTDTLLGMIIDAASIDIYLTAAMYGVLAVSVIDIAASFGAMFTAGSNNS